MRLVQVQHKPVATAEGVHQDYSITPEHLGGRV